MLSTPVLTLPEFELMFIVESDASVVGLGAVLMQQHNLISYFSYALTSREQKKSIYERELMAIVSAILKWKHYLFGKKFLVRIDQRNLKFLLEQRDVFVDYQRWLIKLSGLENKAVDGLSRSMLPSAEVMQLLMALTVPQTLELHALFEEINKNSNIRALIKLVQKGISRWPARWLRWCVKNLEAYTVTISMDWYAQRCSKPHRRMQNLPNT